MYIKRNIDKYLLEWKNTPIHKPLLLRGARQVGKSSAIRELGRSFKYYIEVNFESREDLKEIFEQLSDVHESLRDDILQANSARRNAALFG